MQAQIALVSADVRVSVLCMQPVASKPVCEVNVDMCNLSPVDPEILALPNSIRQRFQIMLTHSDAVTAGMFHQLECFSLSFRLSVGSPSNSLLFLLLAAQATERSYASMIYGQPTEFSGKFPCITDPSVDAATCEATIQAYLHTVPPAEAISVTNPATGITTAVSENTFAQVGTTVQTQQLIQYGIVSASEAHFVAQT